MDVLRTIFFGIFSDTGIIFGYLTSLLKSGEVTQFVKALFCGENLNEWYLIQVTGKL